MMNRRALSEAVLLDSFATLRHADRIVREFQRLDHADDEDTYEPAGQAHEPCADRAVGAPEPASRAYREIVAILGSLRQSRVFIERTTMERLRRTHEKLREVSSATEVAATDMLNGLDYALALVDRLDRDNPDGQAAVTRQELRDELFRLITLLQFQDITSQQLTFASNVLEDIESRLDDVARLFDVAGASVELETEVTADVHGPACDPRASTRDADSRQAVADEVFVQSNGLITG